MEQYFKAVHADEEEKLTISSMYLTADAKLWWRTRIEDDVNAGRPAISTWDRLQKELKEESSEGVEGRGIDP